MKPRNFPARKLERKLLAEQRANANGYCRPFNEQELQLLERARQQRSKKKRG